jgi:hypothetical protein
VKCRYLFFLFVTYFTTKAQFPVTAHIAGKIVFTDSTKDFSAVKILNKRMGDFVLPEHDGSFELYGFKSDTFIFLCQGYEVAQLCYKDSIRKIEYVTIVFLHRPLVNLKEVVIVSPKTIDQIQHEIDSLDVRKTNTFKKIDPVHNVFTLLWETFSKQEKEKRALARLQDKDLRRKAMRELLKICIRDSLIDLKYSQIDAFIDYCAYPDNYLQHVTTYDLLSSFKVNYHYFSGEQQ